MNYIKEINYGTYSGGVQNGFVGYEINFDSLETTHPNSAVIADILQMFLKHPGSKCGWVSLTGTFPINDAYFMFSLTESLRKSGFGLFITIEDAVWHPWIKTDQGDFITVHLKDSVWGPFSFGTLIMDLSSVTQPEPAMPKTHSVVQPLFLNPVGEIIPKQVFHYIENASLKWNINIQAKRVKEILYQKGDKNE